MPTAACAHVLRGNASLPRCCSDAVPLPLVLQVLQLAFRIYMTQKKVHDAMRVALRLNEVPLIEQSFGKSWVSICWVVYRVPRLGLRGQPTHSSSRSSHTCDDIMLVALRSQSVPCRAELW
jgi:hypothetical protein